MYNKYFKNVRIEFNMLLLFCTVSFTRWCIYDLRLKLIFPDFEYELSNVYYKLLFTLLKIWVSIGIELENIYIYIPWLISIKL